MSGVSWPLFHLWLHVSICQRCPFNQFFYQSFWSTLRLNDFSGSAVQALIDLLALITFASFLHISKFSWNCYLTCTFLFWNMQNKQDKQELNKFTLCSFADLWQNEDEARLCLSASLLALWQLAGLQALCLCPHTSHTPHAGGRGGQLMVVCRHFCFYKISLCLNLSALSIWSIFIWISDLFKKLEGKKNTMGEISV